MEADVEPDEETICEALKKVVIRASGNGSARQSKKCPHEGGFPLS
jgi:hypothetical protein